MSSVTKTSLRLKFKDAVGQSLNKTFDDINPSVDPADVRALSAGIVTNGEIYPVVPVEATKIEKITTTTEEISLA